MGTETETVNIDKPATNEHRHADGPKAAREEDIVPDSWNLYENMLCPIESVSIGDDRHIHPRSHGDMRRAVCVAFIILITAACLVGIPYDTSSCLDYQGSHTAIQDLQHRGITLSNVCSIFHFKSDIPMAGWLTIGLPLFVTTITIPDFEHPNHAITTKRYERMTASNVWSIDRRFTIAITILCAIPYAAADPISGGSPSQPTGTSASTSRLLIISAALVVLGNVLGNVSMALTGAFGVLLMPVSAISCVLLIITTTNTDDMPLWMYVTTFSPELHANYWLTCSKGATL